MSVDETTSDRPVRAGRREWLGLAVLALPSFLGMVDISVLFLALPRLTADLGASSGQQLWISDIYGFLSAGFLVTMGTLGDRIGRRRLLLVGAAAFGVLSLLAAWAPNPETLIVTRALLGIAGATLIPTTLALITQMFRDPKQMGIAMATWASSLTLGVAAGPVIGGVLLHWFWWGSVFLIGAPIMLLVLVFGRAVLPEGRNPRAGRLDPLSVVLSLASILSVIRGFTEMAREGWAVDPVLWVLLGLAAGLAFVIRQRRLADPLLDLRLFGIRAVGGALAVALLIAAIQGGSGFFLAQHLQVVGGRSPLGAGLWILVPTFVLLVGIGVSQGLAQRIRPAYVVGGGAVVAALGMVILSQLSASSGVATVIVGFSIVYFGVSPVGPVISQLVVPAAPPEKAGSASSLQTTSGDLGVAVGIALLGGVGAAVYRGGVAVPSELAGTPAGEAADDTVAGALQVAQSLPGQVGEALATSAREAFTSGLTTVAGICAAVFVGIAVLAVSTMRGVPPLAAHGHDADGHEVPVTAATPGDPEAAEAA